MLPVVSGKPETRRQIVIYTVLVVGCGFAPAILGFAGPLYLAANAGIGLWFLVQSLRVAAERDTVREPQARKLFGVSILYLFALFAALLVEAGVGIGPIADLWAEKGAAGTEEVDERQSGRKARCGDLGLDVGELTSVDRCSRDLVCFNPLYKSSSSPARRASPYPPQLPSTPILSTRHRSVQ